MIEAVESMDGYAGSNVAAEDVAPHEIVTDTVGTGVELADGDEASWDGIAMAFNHAEWIHDHDEDTDPLVYQASENDRVPYGGYEDVAVIRPLTIDDDTVAAPSIQEGDVVGVPDTTSTDAPASPGRVVEDGYTADADGDGAATTFSVANGNLLPVGRALPQGLGQLNVTDYDAQIRVQVDKSLL